jgi:hypothetical protein
MNPIQSALADATQDVSETTSAVNHEVKDGFVELMERGGRLLKTARAFGFPELLSSIGLRRKSSPWAQLGLFSTGVLVGATAGLLLAPSSGAKLREQIVTRTKRTLFPAKQVPGTHLAPVAPEPVRIESNHVEEKKPAEHVAAKDMDGVNHKRDGAGR